MRRLLIFLAYLKIRTIPKIYKYGILKKWGIGNLYILVPPSLHYSISPYKRAF